MVHGPGQRSHGALQQKFQGPSSSRNNLGACRGKQGVAVLAFGADEFPAFFTARSGCRAPLRVDSAAEAAAVIGASRQLGLDSATLIGAHYIFALPSSIYSLHAICWGSSGQLSGSRSVSSMVRFRQCELKPCEQEPKFAQRCARGALEARVIDLRLIG